jgi:NFU1 iron-sulfur cluster scaffold homolog, mitochondrial
MPVRVKHFRDTPNPNALKCVLDARVGSTVRSYFSPAAAHRAGDALAIALFAIPDVTNVLIQPDWLTVCKTPEAAWPPIKAAVEAALAKVDPVA